MGRPPTRRDWAGLDFFVSFLYQDKNESPPGEGKAGTRDKSD
jgi:hypothetical protein